MLDDFYLNLYTSQVEYKEGNKNRMSEGLVHLASDDATVGNIEDALTDKNYNYRRDHSVRGGYRVDTEKQYKGWVAMQVFSPDNVGAVLSIGLGVGTQSVTKSSVRGWSFMSSQESLQPLGLGSTGRNVANTLDEALAMKEVMSKPSLGKPVIEGLGDSRWAGWTKLEYKHMGLGGDNITIHYVGKFENGRLSAIDDFKFIDKIKQ